MIYSNLECCLIFLVGMLGAFAFILLSSIIFNRFVLQNDVFADWITGTLYCILGGIIVLFLQWGTTSVLPSGYIWVAVKGFSWSGVFTGLVNITYTRRELPNQRELLEEVGFEQLRESI